MFQNRGRSGKGIHSRRYDSFSGVDFSTDPTLVDPRRSPWAPNLISDAGGFPEKRPGWKTLYTLPDRINGIYDLKVGETTYILIHAGKMIYGVENNAPRLMFSKLSDERSSGVVINGELWLLTGKEYVAIGCKDENFYINHVQDIATIPTTCISRDPAGGGKLLQPVNLLSPKRTCSFLGTATDTIYQLDAPSLDTTVVVAKVNGVVKTAYTDYTVDRSLGQVTFVTAPGVSAVMGQDNVVITYSRTVAGYLDRVQKCRCITNYGLGANNHVFMGSNPLFPNQDCHSAIDNPAYFPDTSFALIGGGQSEIMGYIRMGEYLAIVKESSSEDSSVFLRSVEYDADNGIRFPVRAGISGVGAISRYAILNLRDDPLFLSATGVFAIASRSISQEKTVQNRSGRINSRLGQEPNLSQAVAVAWGNYCVLAVNGRCYVADARQQSAGNSQTVFEYEWYHWDNIPARVLKSTGSQLFFGTDQGRVCVFREDEGITRYNDDGAPIVASWSTKADDDGDFMRLKAMPRSGSGVLVKPYTRSSVKIYLRTEHDFGVLARSGYVGIFDFSQLDFSRLTFTTGESPQVIPIMAKVEGYQTLQVTVENDALNEGFGVFGIVRRFTRGRLVR